jgi:hypothetical protein
MIAMTKTIQEKMQATDFKGNPEEMECDSEHREVPKEEAEAMSVGGLRKRRRDRNLAAGRCQKPKERIQASCESRKRLNVAGRRMTRYAGVAWLRRGVVRKDCTTAKVERTTQRVRPLRKKLWTHHEGKRGTKKLGSKRPLYVRKKRATAIGIGGWSPRHLSPLGRIGPIYKTLKKTLELEFVMRANGMSSGFQKMRKWTLWAGRPPPTRKRDRARSRSRKCGNTSHSGQFCPPPKRNG